jgi:hypothetical protein
MDKLDEIRHTRKEIVKEEKRAKEADNMKDWYNAELSKKQLEDKFRKLF